MPVRIRTLRVLPNPWQYIDHRGRPAGVCPCDPNEHTPDRRWVGATIGEAVLVRSALSRVVAGVIQEISAADHDLRWKYETEPVVLPNTGYYRDKIRKGELIAADEVTSREGGLRKFEDPKAVLERAKAEAIKEFDALNGEGAFKLLGEQYAEDEAGREAVKKAVEAEQSGASDTEKPAQPGKPQPLWSQEPDRT